MSEPKTVLMIGATGATGSFVLPSLLSSPLVGTVVSFGRRAPTLPPSTTETDRAKLKWQSIDFEALLESPPSATEVQKLRDVAADAVVITLGTTRVDAGGMDNFVRIDREYVLAAARAARVEGKEQTLVYCSSSGGSSKSWFPYLKSKGLTEEGLGAAGYSDTIIFKPGMLVVPEKREKPKPFEGISVKVTGIAALFSDSIQIGTPVLGKAMAHAALHGSRQLGTHGASVTMPNGSTAWVLGNVDALKLGKASEV